jgi:drug/metabolite transporter (DMT)-like permease
MIVLSRVNLSFAYPMIALTYVLVPLAAWLFLNEPAIPPIRWVGMCVIIVGVVLVAQS